MLLKDNLDQYKEKAKKQYLKQKNNIKNQYNEKSNHIRKKYFNNATNAQLLWAAKPTNWTYIDDAKRLKRETEEATIQRFPLKDPNKLYDNEQDAWRHAFLSAKATRDMGAKRAHDLLDANEKKPDNSKLSKKMDFWNNSIGQSLATDSRTKNLSNEQIADLALKAGLLQTDKHQDQSEILDRYKNYLEKKIADRHNTTPQELTPDSIYTKDALANLKPTNNSNDIKLNPSVSTSEDIFLDNRMKELEDKIWNKDKIEHFGNTIDIYTKDLQRGTGYYDNY